LSTAKIGFVSLGCPKALVDSERIITQLKIEGYEVVSSYEDANLVVINTCGFIDSAVEESLDAIGEALAENGRVIVTGCLGERAEIIQENYPNVLAVTGAHAYQDVMTEVHRHLPPVHEPYVDLVPPQGVKLTPPHYAYLKISEGCNHHCTFCIIPSLRGRLVSRPFGDIMDEAKKLVEGGVQELLIISQDTSAYGVDIKYRQGFWQGRLHKSDLETLVKVLSTLGVWVRLHYVYPYPAVDKVVVLMAEGKLLPYLDVPLQHSSPTVLKSMKRPGDIEKTLSRIEKWREICPEITLRSTFIVGFPGETEQDFQHLLEFLKQAQLDQVGCFTYSAVDGAEANDLGLIEVDEEIKQQRYDAFMSLQRDISREKLRKKIGEKITIIVDGSEGDNAVARSQGQAPEIDGNVFLDGYDELPSGAMYDVTVVGSDDYDLWAEL
jgi:ribosomal protein S12 methylthiotransferase